MSEKFAPVRVTESMVQAAQVAMLGLPTASASTVRKGIEAALSAQVVPNGWQLVMVPEDTPGGEPDWEDVRERAEEATGIKCGAVISVLIREVRRWLAHRAALAAAPDAPTDQAGRGAVRLLQFARSVLGPDWETGDGESEPFRTWCAEVDALLSGQVEQAENARPVHITAIGEIKFNDSDEPDVSWFLEGGAYELAEGTLLLAADREVTDDEGHGEVYTTPPAALAQPLTADELDLCQQWFNAVQDCNGGYLDLKDYELADRIYRLLGRRVPSSIGGALKGDPA